MTHYASLQDLTQQRNRIEARMPLSKAEKKAQKNAAHKKLHALKQSLAGLAGGQAADPMAAALASGADFVPLGGSADHVPQTQVRISRPSKRDRPKSEPMVLGMSSLPASRPAGHSIAAFKPTAREESKRLDRLDRFADHFSDIGAGAPDMPKIRIKQGAVDRIQYEGELVGTCTEVEKEFFRITDVVDPASVRPQSVLVMAIELVKTRWRRDHDYKYAWTQLKSIRQDLRLQNIRNNFCVHVYETHARIALEEGDLDEFNQCQTMLVELYSEGLPGRVGEFAAYRLLYLLYRKDHQSLAVTQLSYTMPTRDTAACLDAIQQSPAVQHALQVVSAMHMGNYHRFFKLYQDCPNMGAYLMDFLVWDMRVLAWKAIVTSYYPTVGADFVKDELALPDDVELRSFVNRVEGKWTAAGEIDTVASRATI